MENQIEVKLYARYFLDTDFLDTKECPLARAFKEQCQDIIQDYDVSVGAYTIGLYDKTDLNSWKKPIKDLEIIDGYGYGEFLADEQKILRECPDYKSNEPIRVITLIIPK